MYDPGLLRFQKEKRVGNMSQTHYDVSELVATWIGSQTTESVSDVMRRLQKETGSHAQTLTA